MKKKLYLFLCVFVCVFYVNSQDNSDLQNIEDMQNQLLQAFGNQDIFEEEKTISEMDILNILETSNEIIAEEMIENMQQEIACLQPYQQDKLQQEIDMVQNGNQDEFYLQDSVFYKHDKNLASKITEESVELYNQVVEKVVGPFYTEDSFGPVQE